MANLTITAVRSEPRVWKGDHGTFHIYDVEYTGDESGKGQIKQKETSPPPTVGLKGDYELVKKGDFPPELKKAYNGGGGKSYGKSPQELAEMRRMSAQKQAIALLAVEVQAGKDFKEVPATELLKPRIDWFYKDLAETQP